MTYYMGACGDYVVYYAVVGEHYIIYYTEAGGALYDILHGAVCTI